MLVAGDTGAAIAVTVTKPDGTVIDLTGYTATFTFEVDGGALLQKKTVAMTVLDPATDGVVLYNFEGSDLPQPTSRPLANLLGEVQIVDSGGGSLTSVSTIQIPIRGRL